MRRLWVLALAFLATSAVADPPASPPVSAVTEEDRHAAAEQVLAAIAAHDDARLKELASVDDPDPWMVADILIGRGEIVAAIAFAKAAPRPDTARLPEYVESRRGHTPDLEARRTFREAKRRTDGTVGTAEQWALWESIVPRDEPVLSLRVRGCQCGLLMDLERNEEGQALAESVADETRNLGWLSYGALTLRWASDCARWRSRFQDAVRISTQRAEVEHERGNLRGEGQVLEHVGELHRHLNEHALALDILRRAEEVALRAGDGETAATAASEGGFTLTDLEQYAEAVAAFAHAEELARAAGLPRRVASAATMRGRALLALGKYEPALTAVLEALPALEEHARTDSDRQDVAAAHDIAAAAYVGLNDLAKAIEHREAAAAGYEALHLDALAAKQRDRLGRHLYDSGRFPESAVAWSAALELHVRAVSAPDVIALCRCKLGIALRKSGRPADAVRELRAGIPDLDGGPNGSAGPALYATCHDELGRAYRELSQPESAIEPFQTAARIRQDLKLEREEAWTLHFLSLALYDVRRVEESVETRLRAADLYRRTREFQEEGRVRLWAAKNLLSRDRLEEALTQARMAAAAAAEARDTETEIDARRCEGATLAALGDTEAARRVLTENLVAARASGNAELVADHLNRLGVIALKERDESLAISRFEEALREYPAESHTGRGEVEFGLGRSYQRLGRSAESAVHYRESLRLLRMAGKAKRAAEASWNFGSQLMTVGEYASALDVLETSLREQEKSGSTEHLAKTHERIGSVYLIVGDTDRARASFQAALRAAFSSSDTEVAAWALGGIVLLAAQEGDTKAALALVRLAVGMAESARDRSDAALASALYAYCLLRAGDLPAAREAAERGLSLYAGTNDTPTPTERALLALILERQGDHAEAMRRFEDVRAQAEQDGEVWAMVVSMTGVAAAHLAHGDADAAVSAAKTALRHLNQSVQGLDEERATTSRQWVSDLFTIGAWAAVRKGDAGEALSFLDGGRAGALLEALGGRDVLQGAQVPEALLREETEVRVALAGVQARLRDPATPRAERLRVRAEQDALLDRSRQVVERIQREAKAAASVTRPEAATPEALRATLAPNEALVMYGLGGKDAKDLFGLDDGALGVVVTRDSVRAVRLGPAPAIEAACTALRPDARDAPWEAPAAALRALVADPLGVPASVRRVFVSPDASLSYVPFALLWPDREVVYVPSGTTYDLLLADRTKRGDGVLALGDPDPGERPVTSGLLVRGRTLSRLPGTRVEAEAVGDRVLLDQEATESAFRKALAERPRWHAVHLGCHGLIDSVRPVLSSLALTPSSEDDGFLSMLDVFRMRVPADLVVLSACETARGKVCRGEGVMGLARAFMFAGSPRVICSLWEVDDEATQALMTRFYALWNPKDGTEPLGPAAALKAAQEYVRSQERWSHPFYWAAWTLWGLAD